MDHVHLNWFTKDEHFPFFIQYGGHDEDAPLHAHSDFSELVIVLNGNATHIVNNEESFIKKGHVFVINSGTSHGYKDPHVFKICNIMYKPEMLNHAGADLRTSKGFQALFILEPYYRKLQSFESKLNLSITSLDHVSSLIAVMIEEYHNQLQGYKTMLAARFMELIVYLSRQYVNQENDQSSNVMHLAAAVSYIEDRYLEPIALEDIAVQSNISVRHLNRIFKSHYNTSPMAYLQRLRLERACALLKQTNLSVTEVSFQCGFNDSNYLTRQFKKTLGISPKVYRQYEGTLPESH